MKKNLLLSCLLVIYSFAGVYATNTWPVKLTKADGLPGKMTGDFYRFTTRKYSFGEAVQNVRLTILSNMEFDAATTGYNGLSAGTGPGFPFFVFSELKVLDANGNNVTYTPTSNAPELSEGSLDYLYDSDNATYFHSVWSNKGYIPQAYHYLELELAEPLSSFSLIWDTRKNNALTPPTSVALTAGDLFIPHAEMGMKVGEKATTLDELSEEGALFLIKGNVEPYNHLDAEGNDTGRQLEGGGYFHSPYGAATIPSAEDLVYLTPAGADNTYRVYWLINKKFIGTCAGAAWLNWTNVESGSGKIEFAPALVTGDFTMKMAGYKDTDQKEYYIAQEGLIRMRTVASDYDPLLADPIGRPIAKNFTLYKATVIGSMVKAELDSAIIEAERRIIIGGGKTSVDGGEYDALIAELTKAKALSASSTATSTQIMACAGHVKTLTAAYAALRLYQFADSIEYILNDPSIEFCKAPDWVSGAFPEEGKVGLGKASDAALSAAESYSSIADVDVAVKAISSAISAFWSSVIGNVISLPFRMNDEANNLPGTKEGNNWIWESPVIYLNEPINSLRFTVFKTNTGETFKEWVFFTLGEFILMDAGGNKIELTESNFSTNSLAQDDGIGLAGLCDGDNATHYHSAWSDSHTVPTAYVYLDINLPQPVSAFKYKQVGRGNGANTPSDFVFGKGGQAVTPSDVPAPDLWNGVLGTKVTDVSQISEEGIYAIYGNLGVHPEEGWEPFKGSFFKGGSSVTNFASSCAFVFEPAGDGKFYIKSLFDNKYWKLSYTTGGAVTPTYYKSEAAPFNITPSNNSAEVLKDAFRFWYPHPTDPTKAYLYQSWANVGSYELAADFSNDDKDGESEWFIYRMTMDNPYQYWLINSVSAAGAMGLVESADPGFYSNLGTFPTALTAAQAAVDAGDFSNSKALVVALNNAMHYIADVETNPIVEGGIYVIESSFVDFFNKQEVYKNLYFTEDGQGFSWGNSNKEDSAYWFKLNKSTLTTELEEMVEAGTITAENAANAYTLQNVKYGNYIGFGGDLSATVPVSETPETYIILPFNGGKFAFRNLNNAAWCIHTGGHASGAGIGGSLVNWGSDTPASQWHLRTVNPTSISDLNVGDESGEIVSTTYYTINGAANQTPANGINIKRVVYTDGKIRSTKIFVK